MGHSYLFRRAARHLIRRDGESKGLSEWEIKTNQIEVEKNIAMGALDPIGFLLVWKREDDLYKPK